MLGRPSDYTMDMALEICSRLAQGEPLTKICKEEDKPHVSTVYRWIAALPDFRDMYTRAREDQADTLADEIIAISDDSANDTYENEEGKTLTNQEVVARARLRVDARKWVAAKLKPKKYGDKLTSEVSGPDGQPQRFEFGWQSSK